MAFNLPQTITEIGTDMKSALSAVVDLATLEGKVINSEGYKLPSGLTADRAVAPSPGEVRWNTSVGKAEMYDGTKWMTVNTLVNGFAPAEGDILYVDSAGDLVRLAAGAEGTGLVMGANVPEWAAGAGLSYTAAVVTSTGTSFTFSGLPAGIRELYVLFDGVSLDGSDHVLVQLGDAGGVETTGYTSGSQNNGTNVGSTNGFVVVSGSNIRENESLMKIMNFGGNNTWIAAGAGYTTGNNTATHAGEKTLSGELTSVTVTRTGVDNFDAGNIILAYR